MGLLHVPGEIVRLIVKYIKPEDLLHLAASSPHFQYLLWDKHTCWSALQDHRFSVEYKDAVRTGNYARALRRLAKRRDAVRTAEPFQILQIASTSHFIYSHGAVCYTADKHYLRVLHLRDSLLRGPVSQELVIDVRRLLAFTVFPMIGFQESSEYTFEPIHHAHNILSCLFSRADRRCWRNFLIVIDLEKRQVINHTLIPDPRELFVRNNESYLYYGTRSEPRDDDRKRWILQGLDLERGQWLSSRLILRDFVGMEIGSAICFEIFDDYLYCLSNQRMLEPGETVRNSFFYALRFRLGDAQTELEVKSLQKVVMWRRRADEGPVDERWNTLELSRDEKTGKVFIIETRKEFFSAVSQSLRTCYKMELVFPASAPDPAIGNIPVGSDDAHNGPHEPLNEDTDDPGHTDNVEEPEDSDDPDDSDDHCVSDFGRAWAASACETQSRELLHYGDEESSPITLTFHQTFVQSYNASCQAFVDVVNHPPAADSTKKRLRLRSRPRGSGPQPRNVAYLQNLLRKDRDTEVNFWPDPSLPGSDRLCEIMSPEQGFDKADSAMDDRFLVYCLRSYDSEREESPLILVSFDPALHLLGLPRFYSPISHCCDGSQTLAASTGGESSTPTSSYSSFSDQTSSHDLCSNSEYAALAASPTPPPSSCWITNRIATYITRVKDGAVRGFDLSREPCRSPSH